VSFQALNTPKLIFGWGSAQDRAEGAWDTPPGPIQLGSGKPSLHIPHHRRLRRHDLGTYMALRLSVPQPKFLSMHMCVTLKLLLLRFVPLLAPNPGDATATKSQISLKTILYTTDSDKL